MSWLPAQYARQAIRRIMVHACASSKA